MKHDERNRNKQLHVDKTPNYRTIPIIIYVNDELHKMDVSIKLDQSGYKVIGIHDIYTIWERKRNNITHLILIVEKYTLFNNQ